jgi:hypothetical protein
MWPYRGSQKDYGYEFAPTSAQSVGEIDASDNKTVYFYNGSSNVQHMSLKQFMGTP